MQVAKSSQFQPENAPTLHGDKLITREQNDTVQIWYKDCAQET